MSLTSSSLSFQEFNTMKEKSAVSIRSGTTPLVTAETAFWRIGAKGMML
jgi:hypothetical protein